MNYRMEDGSIKSQSEIRALNKHISIPKVWTDEVCTSLNISPILESRKPEPSEAYKRVVRNGIAQDGDNWVEAWIEQDMFADTTIDGVTTTKSEHETAYQARLDTEAAAKVRETRNNLLVKTDWTGASDVTMSTAMATYRQALRDLPEHSNFPNLDSDDWPTAP